MKNKEIEELLNDLKNTADTSFFAVCSSKEELEKMPRGVCKFLSLNDKQVKLLLSYIEQLEKENEFLKLDNPSANMKHFEMLKENKRKIDNLRHQNKQLENNRDKAIEVINTQLKNADGGAKDNLRIIKFNLIKGSCTFEDLKTEEDYKYILKGDSDE